MTWALPQKVGIPLPTPTKTSLPFWSGCARNTLQFQRCRSCDRPQEIPGRICRWCLSNHLDWEGSAGLGSLFSWTTVWRAQTPAFETPYVAAIVELDEGFRILSNLVNVEIESISLPCRVRVLFHDLEGGFTLPYFEPHDDDG